MFLSLRINLKICGKNSILIIYIHFTLAAWTPERWQKKTKGRKVRSFYQQTKWLKFNLGKFSADHKLIFHKSKTIFVFFRMVMPESRIMRRNISVYSGERKNPHGKNRISTYNFIFYFSRAPSNSKRWGIEESHVLFEQ